jgi:hypothetical protein
MMGDNIDGTLYFQRKKLFYAFDVSIKDNVFSP